MFPPPPYTHTPINRSTHPNTSAIYNDQKEVHYTLRMYVYTCHYISWAYPETLYRTVGLESVVGQQNTWPAPAGTRERSPHQLLINHCILHRRIMYSNRKLYVHMYECSHVHMVTYSVEKHLSLVQLCLRLTVRLCCVRVCVCAYVCITKSKTQSVHIFNSITINSSQGYPISRGGQGRGATSRTSEREVDAGSPLPPLPW